MHKVIIRGSTVSQIKALKIASKMGSSCTVKPSYLRNAIKSREKVVRKLPARFIELEGKPIYLEFKHMKDKLFFEMSI